MTPTKPKGSSLSVAKRVYVRCHSSHAAAATAPVCAREHSGQRERPQGSGHGRRTSPDGRGEWRAGRRPASAAARDAARPSALPHSHRRGRRRLHLRPRPLAPPRRFGRGCLRRRPVRRHRVQLVPDHRGGTHPQQDAERLDAEEWPIATRGRQLARRSPSSSSSDPDGPLV
jgi:hypothetical protein